MVQYSSKPMHDFLSKLEGVEESANGYMAFCPNHEQGGEAANHQRSLSIAMGDDGRVLIKCFSGCVTAAVVHSVGMMVAELFPERIANSKSKRPRGKKVAEYDYRDADGVLIYQAVRFEEETTGEKTFTQRRPSGAGGWVYSMRGVTRILYRLPELIQANENDVVYVVEGEKKVEALMAWGLIATCNVGGAGKWSRSYSERLKNRRVVILPDNDVPGWDHAVKIAESLRDIGCRNQPKIITLPGLSPKGDVVDWIASGGTREKLAELVAEAKDAVPPAEVAAEIERQELAISSRDALSLLNHDSRTDIGNGRRLVKRHGQDLRYCHPWGKWLVWDGQRWKNDDTAEIQRRATDVADESWKELVSYQKDIDAELHAKILAFARYTSSVIAMTRMVTAAASESGTPVVPGQLDADPWVLNCLNGTVDLRTGVLMPHDRSRMLTKLAPVEFHPDAKSPVWDRFLLSVFGGDQSMVDYIRRLCGYWVTGAVREQILPILHGSGANGKTTFLNTFMDILGPDYAMKAVPDFLMVKRNDAHPTDKADLFGKRFVACSETEEGRRLAESTVKELTGSEKVRARRMREDFWEFNPTHKIALVTNHRPIVSGTDVGIWRRLRLIPFEVRFWDADHEEAGGREDLRQDKDLSVKLIGEHQGILSWIVRGCIEWLHDGEQSPEAVRRETDRYKTSQDILGQFLTECCATGPLYAIRSGDIYSAYKAWCETNNEYLVSQRKFGQAMTERGFDRYTNNGIFYRRITLVGLANTSSPDHTV